MTTLAWLRRRLFGIKDHEIRFVTLGFPLQPADRVERLEYIAASFAFGYHAALVAPDLTTLAEELQTYPQAERGFAFEGAGMALALRDLLHPLGGDSLMRFVEGAGAPHVYMLHVGAGWALARVPVRRRWLIERMHPLHRWLALEGFGFHEGFFHTQAALAGQRTPGFLRPEELRVFHQGLGRSLWFSQTCHPDRVAEAIGRFPAELRGALWSGIGLASTYAGGLDQQGEHLLLSILGEHLGDFAQGVLFAAAARSRAGNPSPGSRRFAERIWGDALDRSVAETIALGETPPTDPTALAFNQWCASIVALHPEDLVNRDADPEPRRNDHP